MKIAVTSTGPTMEHYVGRQASRCGYLLIIDPDTMQYDALQNPVLALKGPAAGRLFAQLLLQEGVHTILMGGSDPDTLRVLGEANISIRICMTGSVRRVVEQFRDSHCSGLT